MKGTEGVFIHPTAVIDSPSEIGEGTKIWHFCHVMPHSIIGSNCILGMGVFVDSNVRIGDGVKLENNVSVYNGVTLEDDVFCGPSVVFTNVINPRSHISRKHEFRQTLVKQGATLGANSTIVCGVTIGRFAMTGAGSVVTHDIPDFALVYGNPAKLKAWVCQCGVKLLRRGPVGEERYSCPACGADYAHDGNGLLGPVAAE